MLLPAVGGCPIPFEPNQSSWNQPRPDAAVLMLPQFFIFGHICDVNSEKQTFILGEREWREKMQVYTVNNQTQNDCRGSLLQK